jgi:hypothetical protein
MLECLPEDLYQVRNVPSAPLREFVGQTKQPRPARQHMVVGMMHHIIKGGA